MMWWHRAWKQLKKLVRKVSAPAKNDDLLPLQEDVRKLNVFGWDSIHPLLGGTGSSASSAAAATDLLGSLENAGYEVNETLTKMYRDYRDERTGYRYEQHGF